MQQLLHHLVSVLTLLFRAFSRHQCQPPGIDAPGAYRVDRNSERAQLQRQCLCVTQHTRPGRNRQTQSRQRLPCRHRSDVDDAPAARSFHVGHGLPDHADDAVEILFYRFLPGDIVEFFDRAERRRAVVVHQDIYAAKDFDRVFHHPDTILGAPYIRCDGEHARACFRADHFGGCVERRLAPCCHDDPRAFFGQCAGDRAAYSLARAVHDCDLIKQMQVHAVSWRPVGPRIKSGASLTT